MTTKGKNSGNDAPARALTKMALQEFADERSFERGVRYFEEGRVTSLTEHRGEVIATVKGSRMYTARLREEGGLLEGSCSCPVGKSGGFCKHCVAAGLAWLEEQKKERKTPREPSEAKVTLDDVEEYLSSLPQKELADMIMERICSDTDLRVKLLRKAARSRPEKLDMKTYRDALDYAFKIPDFVFYSESWDYTQDAMEAVFSIEELLKEGYAAEVIDLVEYALKLWEENIEHIDDSDGGMGKISERLQVLHLRACLAVKPDPEALARKLFEREMSTE